MSYLAYYLVWFVLAYAVRQPVLLVGIVLFVLLRRYIPDPGAIWRALGRASSLRNQVSVNAANVTARRDLAVIYLDLRRPKAALALLEQALVRDPNDADLLYLLGLALHRAGRHEDALGPLVRSVEKRSTLRYGAPYMVAGDALLALRRLEEAVDAYERYASINHSDVGVHVQLARAHARAGDRAAVRVSLAKAMDTWSSVPGSIRRKSVGRWFEAMWLRARLLGDPMVIGTTLALAGTVVVGARFALPHVRSAFAVAAPFAQLATGGYDRDEGHLRAAQKLCGSQSTGDLAGKYRIEVLSADGTDPASATSPQERASFESIRKYFDEQYANFEVRNDRIVSGTHSLQEICLSRVLERTATGIRAEAVLRQVDENPEEASLVELRFEKEGDAYRFTCGHPDVPHETWLQARAIRQ